MVEIVVEVVVVIEDKIVVADKVEIEGNVEIEDKDKVVIGDKVVLEDKLDDKILVEYLKIQFFDLNYNKMVSLKMIDYTIVVLDMYRIGLDDFLIFSRDILES